MFNGLRVSRYSNGVIFLSAGGVGVMFHIDKIAGQLRNVGSNAEVRGISDSGWFIESGHIPPNGNLKHWKVPGTRYLITCL